MKTKLPTKKTFYVEVNDFSKGIDSLKSENVLKPQYAVSCYNFSYENGALVSNFGMKDVDIEYSIFFDEKAPLAIPEGIEFKKVWQFKHWDRNNELRRDKLMVWASDTNIYYTTLFSADPELKLTNMVFNEEPEQLNYKIEDIDYNICISEMDGMKVWDGANAPYEYTSNPHIRSFCASNGKFYATFGGDRSVIRYTTNEDLTTWYVHLGVDDKELTLKDNLGRINKVVSHLNYVYAFRDFGITKISRSANSTITTSNLFFSSNTLYDKTIANCMDDIYFLCRDGIYVFNGADAKKVDTKLDKYLMGIDNQKAVGCFYNGNYYLALKMDFKDDKNIGCENGNYINNALIKINVQNNSVEIIRGVDICSMCDIHFDRIEKLVFCFNSEYTNKIGELDYSGTIFDNVANRSWTSPLSDLGFGENVKFVRELSVDSQYPCTIRVFSEDEEQIINIDPEKIYNKYRVRVKGKKIGFEISSTSQNNNISNLKLKIDLMEGSVY